MAQNLSELKRNKRVLLVMDTENDAAFRSEQLQIFDNYSEEMKERDLVTYCYTGDSMLDRNENPVAMDVTEVPEKDFQGVILIGKDGGVKSMDKFVVDPKTIFDRIDAMPMRQSEMRASKKH